VSRFLKTMRQYINPRSIGVAFDRLRSAPLFATIRFRGLRTNRTETRRSRERSNRLWRNAAGGALRAPSIHRIARATALEAEKNPSAE
jgi:hypothetical protein